MDIGQGIHESAVGFAEAYQRTRHRIDQEHNDAQIAQALLDTARSMHIPDQKTGKPTQFFKDDQLQYVQRLIDQKKFKAAGAAEAAMGIGKDMLNRIGTAAAKQQAAQQAIQQGPVLTTVPGHGNYRWTGKEYVPDTAVPRNQMGLSADQQLDLQRGISKDANAAQTAQFKAQQQAKVAQTKIFNAFLKSNGISSPTDLFDPSIQQGGVFDPRTGFVQTDPNAGPQSHIRLYHKPGEMDDQGKPVLDRSGNPVGAKAGVVLPTSQVVDMQNAAASMAGPQALQALDWLRQNPDSKHAAAVAAEISRRMGEIDQAPAPTDFSPTPPSFAPAQPPTAAFQQEAPTQDTTSDEYTAE